MGEWGWVPWLETWHSIKRCLVYHMRGWVASYIHVVMIYTPTCYMFIELVWLARPLFCYLQSYIYYSIGCNLLAFVCMASIHNVGTKWGVWIASYKGLGVIELGWVLASCIVHLYIGSTVVTYTVKPPNKVHIGDGPVAPSREVVLFSEVFF